MRSSGFAMRTLGLLALGAAMAVALPAGADELEAIRAKGEIRVAVYNDFPPYSAAGKGIDVELARAIAGKLGLRVDLVWFNADENMDDDLRNMVWKGHYLGGRTAHLMMHVPVDPLLQENNDKVRILAPYHREQLAFARNTLRIPNLSGMAGLEAFTREKVGVETATLADDFLMGAFGGRIRDNVVHFKSLPEAATALKAGQVSAIMGPFGELEGAVGRGAPNISIQPFRPSGLAVSSWNVGVAVKQENPDLAAAVERAIGALNEDGTLQRIFASGGVTHTPPMPVQK
ncbi:MAG TPA: transporter substrate-binding domain-containing protein [Burkholderiales bacterium]|nr:transporter substrate-binding domain-containing protein [Burkholderiales bacterium]